MFSKLADNPQKTPRPVPGAHRRYGTSGLQEAEHSGGDAGILKFLLALPCKKQRPHFNIEPVLAFQLPAQQQGLSGSSLSKELGNEYDYLHAW
jgi:hypothetical protein